MLEFKASYTQLFIIDDPESICQMFSSLLTFDLKLVIIFRSDEMYMFRKIFKLVNVSFSLSGVSNLNLVNDKKEA